MFSKAENERYSRHFRLKDFGSEAQAKLKDARVLVIGAGGLGCPVLQYLAAAGTGTITVADPDIVSLSNLQRQVLYTTDDVGKFKVDIAAERLSLLNPEITLDTLAMRINNSNADQLFGKFDVIVDTTDNIPARYQINDACIRKNRPLVYGAIFRWEGQVSVFNYQDGPTYRCLFPEPPGSMVLSCDEEGVVGVVPGIIGAYQATEVIKIITGTGQVLSGKLLTIDLYSNQSRIIKFSRQEESIKKAFEDPRITEVDAMEMEIYLKDPNVTILDVRTREEFIVANIGGLNIPLSELQDKYQEISENQSLMVLCQSGKRSLEAIRQLREAGFDGTCYNLTEGLQSYQAASGLNE